VKRNWAVLLILAVIGVWLVACGGDQVTPTPESLGGFETYSSPNLDQSYEGALPASNQLSLGTLELEETEDAVTPEQAAVLLPLWQALQSGELQGSAEINAVLGQIEGAMTPEQLQAIAGMRLTWEGMGAWAQEQGIDMAQRPAGGPGGPGQGEISPEARETMRAGFESMTEEERAARRAEMRATAEAGGMSLPAEGERAGLGRGGAGLGRSGLLEPLIELLTARAAGE
jgi:hypothetical protein